MELSDLQKAVRRTSKLNELTPWVWEMDFPSADILTSVDKGRRCTARFCTSGTCLLSFNMELIGMVEGEGEDITEAVADLRSKMQEAIAKATRELNLLGEWAG